MPNLISGDESRRVLLTMSQQPSGGLVVEALVTQLHQRCGAALARVWTLSPQEACVCPHPELCRGQTQCLKLVASAGRSLKGEDWSKTEGEFSRIPIGFGKVGHIALTRQAVEDSAVTPHSSWIARPEWVQKEKIRGLIGQPLLFRDELLGVLAVFTRESPSHDDLAWLRAFADHAAAALANSRAFQQIQQLRDRLELENDYLRDEVKAAQAFGEIVGESPAHKNVLRRIELVAPTGATVLVQGESGSGKELIARAIHEHSSRARQAMITVNCAAIPAELFESEFFGHVQGAFSGATRDRRGRFELADRGTLLLDEIGELPMAMQGKLLRVLEEGTFERVGDDRTRTVDVRVIAATNRDLSHEVAAGRFRKDLFYRLGVFVLDVPPLRERPEDVDALTRHFLAVYCRKYRVPLPKLSRSQAEQLRTYSWPGNVRELRNVMERAVIMLQLGDSRGRLDFPMLSSPAEPRPRSSTLEGSPPLLREAEVRDLERRNLLAVLRHTRWKIGGTNGAAEFLGLHPATLASRLRALNIKRSASEQSDE